MVLYNIQTAQTHTAMTKVTCTNEIRIILLKKDYFSWRRNVQHSTENCLKRASFRC